jgi:DMSO/TMAO reductase YedYZ molybdopterin-dependent catalytic subunit
LVFLISFVAGAVAILFNFLLRLANLAPFPPESALEAVLRIIPESIQEPSVQNLGDFAGQLGLLVATIIAIVVYGVLGLVFQRFVLSKVTRLKLLSSFELFLLYSLAPFLVFGVILLPIFGDSVFGISSPLASSGAIYFFPISLLFVQLLFALFLYYGFKSASILSPTLTRPVVRVTSRNRNSVTSGDPHARRTFLQRGIIIAGILVLSVYSLDKILSVIAAQTPTNSSSQSGTAINLQEAPAIFQDPRLASLVDSEVTSNGSFYRVAIDIIDPSVNAANWSLQVSGAVSNPKSYSLSDLQNSFQAVEEYNTFECVSNDINGNLIGNAKWTGLKISDLLNDVGGVTSNAQYVVFYSVDGYSVALPLSKAMVSDSILAYMMNDQPLPQAHGYPMRVVIPGLYGMMSAKFLNKIEVVGSSYQGYWQSRGWSNVGTVQTVSFIRIPGDGATVSLSQNNGSILLGGMAYAGNRGISNVEVSLDGGKTWQTAQTKTAISNLTWELWAYEWKPSGTGSYNIYARATDGTGATQTLNQTSTFPNGATGYAMTSVNVSS